MSGFDLDRRTLLQAVGAATAVSAVGTGAGTASAASASATPITDWHDLNAVREGLDGEYVLAADLDSETAGYDEHVEVVRSEFTDEFSGADIEAGTTSQLKRSNVEVIIDANYDVELVDAETGVIEWQEDAEFGDPNAVVGYTTVDPVWVGWDPIGESESAGDGTQPFTGTFDGAGHEIADLVVDPTAEIASAGLFAGLEDGRVENLTLRDASVAGGFDAGALAGSVMDGEVVACSALDVSVTGEFGVGGLVGVNEEGTVEACSATGAVDGEVAAGGLVGLNAGVVVDSVAEVDVEGELVAGGLVGIAGGPVDIEGGPLQNSHYNIEAVEINGEHTVTVGGLFPEQFADWEDSGGLDIEAYPSLSVVDGRVEIDSVQGVRDALGFLYDPSREWRLADDLDLTDARSDLRLPYLAGSLDGGGHTVTVDIEVGSVQGAGFVGTNVGTLTSIHLEGTVSGRTSVGAVAGSNGGTITDVTADVDVHAEAVGEDDVSFSNAGGLVGNNDGTIENATVDGAVDGSRQVGGLVGDNGGTVANATAAATVTGDGRVGGLAGNSDGTIENAAAEGSVTGKEQVGGLVGRSDAFGDEVAAVTASRASGPVTGTEQVGGLVGDNGGTVEECVAEGSVTGETDVGGLVGENSGIDDEVAVRRSSATGTVEGETNVGGLVGTNEDAVTAAAARGAVSGNTAVGGLVGVHGGALGDPSLAEAYAAGPVSGEEQVGGVVGTVDTFSDAPIADTYWDVEATGQEAGVGDGDEGVVGLPTEAMWGETAVEEMPGLDFAATWATMTVPPDYPHLQWRAPGTVTGTVTDDDGTPVTEATVEVLADGTPVETAMTDVDGAYELALPPGTYTVAARADGFDRTETDLTVERGDTSTLDVQLDEADDDDSGDGDGDDSGDGDGDDSGDGDDDDGFGPGFGVGTVVTGLGGAYVLRRRLGDGDESDS